MNLNFETDGLDFNSKGKPDEIATPIHICRDMSNLFDYTNCNQKIWMDIFCKTGNTLEALKKHGVNKENIIAICDNKQSQMLVCRKLYGKLLPEIDCRTEINTITRRGQVYYVSDYKNTIKDRKESYIVDIFRTIKEQYMLEFTSEDNFKLNNIIMNPPYNPSDLYIDFVTLAHKIASESTVAITPAKFQAKGGIKNETFRKEVVPYISNIKYYSNPLDVFPNTSMCGDAVCYYMIQNNKPDTININGESYDNWKIRYGFDNTCINILKRINGKSILECGIKEITPCKSYFTSKNFGDVSEDTTSKYYMRSSARCIKVPEIVFNHTEDMDKYKVYIGHFITSNPVIHIVNPYVADVREDCLLGFGTKEFCESLKSYYQCKLIWYLVYMTNCGNASAEAFINVPKPKAFDHIFTDEELYSEYDLAPAEIAIIESVIKEQK